MEIKKNLKRFEAIFTDKNNRLILVFAGFAAVLGILALAMRGSPIIESIDPAIGSPGDEMTVQGRHFGKTQGEGRIEIAGIFPTATSYESWSDNRIRIKIPENVGSGLVRVLTRNGISNSLLFADRSRIPLTMSGTAAETGPYLASLAPPSASVGETVTVTGSGFGAGLPAGALLFSWPAATASETNPAVGGGDATALIGVASGKYGYLSWNDREIKATVPDGAVSGMLMVRTDKGTSNSQYIEIVPRGGVKTYADRKTYAVTCRVDVSNVEAQGQNDLYVWIPGPLETANQRLVKLLSRSHEGTAVDPGNITRYDLRNLTNGQRTVIEQSFLVNVYAIESRTDPAEILPAGSLSPDLDSYLIAADEAVPSGFLDIVTVAKTVAQDTANPYLASRSLYDWLIANVALTTLRVDQDPIDAFTARSADPYSYAVLYCALLRAAGIPAQLSAGYLVDNDLKPHRHWWAQIWFDGFGWFPVDPVLGKGYRIGSFPVQAGNREFYFGNLDGQHVEFSRGYAVLKKMDPNGRPIVKTRMYSMQSIFEESTGTLTSYASYWPDVTVTGVY